MLMQGFILVRQRPTGRLVLSAPLPSRLKRAELAGGEGGADLGGLSEVWRWRRLPGHVSIRSWRAEGPYQPGS